MNSMNRLWFIVLAAVGLFCLSGNMMSVYAVPKMVLPEQSFDFHDAIEGGILVHEFTIQNKGDQPLEINKVETG